MPFSDVPAAGAAALAEPVAGGDLDALLRSLRDTDPRAWRCLRTLLQFDRVPHLACRLHMRQDDLVTMIDSLSQRLGPVHLHCADRRVEVSVALRTAFAALTGPTAPGAPR